MYQHFAPPRPTFVPTGLYPATDVIRDEMMIQEVISKLGSSFVSGVSQSNTFGALIVPPSLEQHPIVDTIARLWESSSFHRQAIITDADKLQNDLEDLPALDSLPLPTLNSQASVFEKLHIVTIHRGTPQYYEWCWQKLLHSDVLGSDRQHEYGEPLPPVILVCPFEFLGTVARDERGWYNLKHGGGFSVLPQFSQYYKLA